MIIFDFYCPKCHNVMESQYEGRSRSKMVCVCTHHRPPLVFHLKKVKRPESELREILSRVGAEDLLEESAP